ncbi:MULTISPECIES: HlyD family secretion protein [Psychrobacter]|uniref:HlyD family secretion protein n=1 Tax=Psychrobacter TaxID=497 RepID=UPI000C335BE8|nr:MULTISPECIES: HlyD family secretion protein [Psychrobacter]MBA6243224.1 HlyD family secretion protein [Psychrobacter sp. Urea-trap-18]MBA6286282.1 HlyD family secretion protein [Psychrobacter sp. Urea-trap-16]MBA6317431.1 HlyD family secretion protein [Psychrobacter sp. Urea-trap-20]MBA6334541.1 HlyD family secretion protein [Psychrobacter sp. Urea-trap-19]PKG60914.1 hemolysin D [Psychrobacter sp. Choline-3u-12]
MSQEKLNELNQTPQTSTGAPATNTPIASDISKEEAAVTSSQSATKTAEGDIENSTDSNETPMPPKEPIPDTTGWSPKKKSYLNLGLLILLIVIGVALILYAWKLPPFTPTVQQTNNAFVKGQTTIISPQVSGYVTKVAVQDFANVKAGDLLIKIDDRTFQQQLDQAQANTEVALTNRSTNDQDTQTSQAQIEARRADLYSAKINVESAREDVNRYQGLDAIGAVSKAEVAHIKAQLAQAQAGVQQAEANLQAAQENREKTSGSRSSLDANIKNAEAGVKQAQINLDNTIITAPESGQLSQVSVKEGQYVSAGTQLMYIVPKGIWIIANFKETQIANMAIGEPATIHVDALGGAKFTGHVSNISPATGSEFSAAAANPATGNYIKIAQRIPVRIDLDQNQPELARLRPGMSVSVDVDTNIK